MSGKTHWKLAAFVWVNLLPYLSRLYRGREWAAQYVPDSNSPILGLIFFHAFYSIPAVPLVLGILLARKSRWPWLLPLLVITVVTVLFHHSYDLASDAQAAIGLIVFPIITAFAGFLALGLGLLVQRMTGNTGQR